VYFPELKDIVKGNYMFARSAALVQDKSSLANDKERIAALEEIVGEGDVAMAVVQASRTSMGVD
jgi:nucleolar protein 56